MSGKLNIDEDYEKLKNSKKVVEKKEVTYNVKNYVNTKVLPSEKEKTVTIRILPIDKNSTSVFNEVYMHWDASAGKSFVCAKNTKNTPEGTDKNCPYCDLKDSAWEEFRNTKIESEKEKYKKIASANNPLQGFVLRVIDRSDESFGPKFLKVTENILDGIKAVKEQYNKVNNDIFDYITGHDLELKYEYEFSTKKSKFKNVLASIIPTPLHADEVTRNTWINDDKKWVDVFTIKSFDYLNIIMTGGDPWFDKPSGKWVDKKELDKKKKDEEEKKNSDNHVDESEYDNDVDESEDGNEPTESEKIDDLPF